MYVLALSDYKQLAAAAGYKPAPQLGRQIAVYQEVKKLANKCWQAFLYVALFVFYQMSSPSGEA